MREPVIITANHLQSALYKFDRQSKSLQRHYRVMRTVPSKSLRLYPHLLRLQSVRVTELTLRVYPVASLCTPLTPDLLHLALLLPLRTTLLLALRNVVALDLIFQTAARILPRQATALEPLRRAAARRRRL